MHKKSRKRTISFAAFFIVSSSPTMPMLCIKQSQCLNKNNSKNYFCTQIIDNQSFALLMKINFYLGIDF